MNTPISLLIVDDNPQFLHTIAEYLREHFPNDIEIIGTTVNGHDAITILKEQKPDFVLLDMKMPELHGFDVVPLMRQNHLPVKIILTTLLPVDIYEDNADVYEESSMFAGANSFIPKSLLTTKLIPVIEAVANLEARKFVSLRSLLHM